MTPEELARAVERLTSPDAPAPRIDYALLKSIAALIEAAARPVGRDPFKRRCMICLKVVPKHHPDCALVALVRAINGEGER